MTDPVRRIVVGDVTDVHVAAIAALLPASGTVVVDAATVTSTVEHLNLDRTRMKDLVGETCVLGSEPALGWLRRLAPAGWDDGAILGAKQAAVLASRMALLAAVMRDPSITWLTPLGANFAAENKIVQYRAARSLGIRVPETSFSGDPGVLAAELGDPFVLKPLGPGAYRDADDRRRVVYSRSVTLDGLQGLDFRAASFLAQRQLDALVHLRVVTVGSAAWTCELQANSLPMDWREKAEAHDSFAATSAFPDVEALAVRLAQSLECGYTSQDWIITATGPHFIDLNPGGQWLFLPESVAGQVTTTLAAALSAENSPSS